MKILYFAWFREDVGLEEEDINLPENVKTVGDLLDHLCAKGPQYEKAFSERVFVRVAVDHEHGTFDTSITGASEVAFFPPITGG